MDGVEEITEMGTTHAVAGQGILGKGKSMLRLIVEVKELGIFIPFIAFFTIVAITHPQFVGPLNLLNLARDISFLLVLALGETIVMISGGIDLSIGMVSSLSAIVSGLILVNHGPVPFAITAGLTTGLACGAINGFLISRVGIPPIIVTLGMMYAAQGIGLILTAGNPLYPFPPEYTFLGRGSFFNIPIPLIVWVALVQAIVVWVLLSRNRFGYWITALGGNREAARRAGLNVLRLGWTPYVLSGLFAAIFGMLMSAYLSSAQPGYGLGWEMQAIVATIVGGTSLFGGVGTVVGTLIGTAIIAMMNDTLVILKIPTFWQNLVIGLIIVVAVGFDTYRRKIRYTPDKTQKSARQVTAVERPDLGLVFEGAGLSVRDLSEGISKNGTPIFSMKGITKYFGYVQALDSVDFDLYPNEVVALVGDNGAGKSTLMKIASGSQMPDSGEILLRGEKINFNGPRDAANRGIAMLYQDLALVDCRDVASNLFLGREPVRFAGMVDIKRMIKGSELMLKGLKMKISSPKTLVQYLSGGQRQGVAIGRAVSQGASILILDEPTAALGVEESSRVLTLIEELKGIGCSVIIISHNLLHVFSIADRIFVLRGGRGAGTWVKSETSADEIVSAITGATMLESIHEPA